MDNVSMRDAFFNRLTELAKSDKNVMIVTADMGAPSLDYFRENLSEQFINVGIAEENMVTVAAGLALSGKKVYIYAIMPFVTIRCYEMLKLELSLMNLPITAVGIGSGFSYDDSGPTHHSTEDITVMRVLPNMTIFNCSDSVMAEKFVDMTYNLKGPSYVRLDRKIFPEIYARQESLVSGLKLIKEGKDLCIVSTGNMVHSALRIAEALREESLATGVIDVYRLKPINTDQLLKYVGNSNRVVTLEEHLLAGGFGSAVCEVIADSNKLIPLRRFGVQDSYYYAYGGRANIQALCGLDDKAIIKSILQWR